MKRFTIFCVSLIILAATTATAQFPVPGSYSKSVVIKTNAGSIEFVLLDATPLHRDNFVQMVDSGFYKGILFHRVIKGFVIQAGDPETKEALATKVYGKASAKHTLPAEIQQDLYHLRGAVGAAREGDDQNPERRSSGSHFYIVQGKPATDSMLNANKTRTGVMPEAVRESYKTSGGTPRLDGAYTVFGYVINGMNTVDKICLEKTDKYDRPHNDIYIKSIVIKTIKKKKK